MATDPVRETEATLATGPRPKAEAATDEECERRLLAVGDWLLDGMSRRDVVIACQKQFGVCRRTAQLDVHKVRRRFAREAMHEDRLFYLRLSQLQRDKAIHLVIQYLKQPGMVLDANAVRRLTALVSAFSRLLDSRDKTVTAIHEMLGYRAQTPAMERAEAQHLSAKARYLHEQNERLLKKHSAKPFPPEVYKLKAKQDVEGGRRARTGGRDGRAPASAESAPAKPQNVAQEKARSAPAQVAPVARQTSAAVQQPSRHASPSRDLTTSPPRDRTTSPPAEAAPARPQNVAQEKARAAPAQDAKRQASPASTANRSAGVPPAPAAGTAALRAPNPMTNPKAPRRVLPPRPGTPEWDIWTGMYGTEVIPLYATGQSKPLSDKEKGKAPVESGDCAACASGVTS